MSKFLNNIVNKSNWYKHLIFSVYIVLLFIIIPKHEPWADEAQAWLLARDSSFLELLFSNLRYEGSPGLWHLILMIPSRILSYDYFNFISGIIGIFAIYLILYRSTLPLLIKLLLPFTYFFFFQYVVVARCYALFLPLIFLLAINYKNRHFKPLLYGVLIIILANINLHGFLFFLSLSLIYFIETVLNWKDYSIKLRKNHISVFLLLAANVIFVILQIIPPADISFSESGFNIDIKHLFEINYKIYGELFTNYKILSYIILSVSIIWFYVKKKLILYLLLNIPLMILFSIYYNIWHQGVLFLIWVFVLCLSFDNSNQEISSKKGFSNVIFHIQYAVVICVMIFHIYWSVIVSVNDYKYDFSAGKKISEYIKTNDLEDKFIYSTHFWAISVLPYFDKNIYQTPNYKDGKSFWIWNKANDCPELPDVIINKQPDLIIFSRPKMFWYPDSINNYYQIDIAKGTVFWKDTIKEINDYRIFRKIE